MSERTATETYGGPNLTGACFQPQDAETCGISGIVPTLASSFGSRLRSVYLYGSHARGEESPDSDYDLIVIVDRIDSDAIRIFSGILTQFPSEKARNGESLIQPFFWSTEQLGGIPPHYFYLGARLLYGDPVLTQPSSEQLQLSFLEITRNLMNTVTHYMILPHDNVHVSRRIYEKLKQLYFALAARHCIDTGSFPSDRSEVIDALRRRGDEEGSDLISILDQWADAGYEESFAQDPRPMLYRMLKYVESLLPEAPGLLRDE